MIIFDLVLPKIEFDYEMSDIVKDSEIVSDGFGHKALKFISKYGADSEKTIILSYEPYSGYVVRQDIDKIGETDFGVKEDTSAINVYSRLVTDPEDIRIFKEKYYGQCGC